MPKIIVIDPSDVEKARSALSLWRGALGNPNIQKYWAYPPDYLLAGFKQNLVDLGVAYDEYATREIALEETGLTPHERDH